MSKTQGNKTKKPKIKDVKDHRSVLDTLDNTSRVETEKRRLAEVMFTAKDSILTKLIQEYIQQLDMIQHEEKLIKKKVLSNVMSVSTVNDKRDQLRNYILHAIIQAEDIYAEANKHKAYIWAEMTPEARDRLIQESCMYKVDDSEWNEMYYCGLARYSDDMQEAIKVAAAQGIALSPFTTSYGIVWTATYKKYDERRRIRHANPATAICLAALKKLNVLVEVPSQPNVIIE